MTKSKEEKRNQLKAYARYSGVAFQMGITIYLGNLLGEWLDEKYQNQQGMYSKVVTLLAVFLSMYLIISQVIRDSNKK